MGYTLLEENFRAPGGEIDLIMQDEPYIVFVEVKLRRSLHYGLPREAINARKRQSIKTTALQYIASRRLHNTDFRFDVVEVLILADGVQVNHIANAFE